MLLEVHELLCEHYQVLRAAYNYYGMQREDTALLTQNYTTFVNFLSACSLMDNALCTPQACEQIFKASSSRTSWVNQVGGASIIRFLHLLCLTAISP